MVTSRSVPQQMAQIFSPFAGQNREAFRFSQTGQSTESPRRQTAVQQNTPRGRKSQKAAWDRVRNVKMQQEADLASRPLVSAGRLCDFARPAGGGIQSDR